VPTKKYHEKLAENLKAIQNGEPLPDEKAEAAKAKRKSELDDAKRQAEIMDPEGAVVALSFGELRLYPFAMFDQATAQGYCSGVNADVFGQGARNSLEFAYRVSASILKSAQNKRELLSLVAIATGKPGEIDNDEKAAPIARDLSQKCSPDDYVILYREIRERAAVKRDPKK
jgi:hypothetical protein